jgi:membrane-bound lytic murein transglycosylase A
MKKKVLLMLKYPGTVEILAHQGDQIVKWISTSFIHSLAKEKSAEKRNLERNTKATFFGLLGYGLTLLLTGCGPQIDRELIPVSFSTLPGWKEDHHLMALPALNQSCRVILKKSPATPMVTQADGSGQAGDWFKFCKKLQSNRFKSHKHLREFLEATISPYQIATSGKVEGVFTGYYEPILNGSLRRHGKYQTPLYKMPGKGINYKIPRSKIVKGALKGRGLELVWVDDPVEAFFLQVQGSGRIRLDNGREIKLGYAGQNGYPYFPIGKALLDKGALPHGHITMQSIKKWLHAHPRQAESIMSQNQSYVFFKINNTPGGPIGSHGVPLTPHRSLAIDRSFISLGTPLWLHATHPDHHKPHLKKLMVAQDTGGAIKGAVRGDYFWGSGPAAATYAGAMNAKGQLYVFLPR